MWCRSHLQKALLRCLCCLCCYYSCVCLLLLVVLKSLLPPLSLPSLSLIWMHSPWWWNKDRRIENIDCLLPA